MANVKVKWVLPTTRASGRPLNPADIKHVEVGLSADGVNFVSVGAFPPDVLETTLEAVDPGDWLVHGVVVDTANRAGAAKLTEFSIADETPPGALVELTVELF